MSIIQAIQNTHKDEKAVSNSINQVTYDEHSVLVINHPKCAAAVSLQGAHLLFWQPTTEQYPVIWLSEKAFFKKETPIRGGIPICWPWFGKGGDPMHGFARIVDWQLKSHTENENGVDLVLSLKDSPKTKQYWPHTFELELTLHLGTTCKVELSCLGDLEAHTALHTYFGVDDITKVTVKGLGATYEERLATTNESKTVGEMTFNQEVDRIYNQPESVLVIEDGKRKIQITNDNCSDVVTWNPWIEKSKASADLADENYKEFVCVETCRINKPIKSTATEKSVYGVTVEVIK